MSKNLSDLFRKFKHETETLWSKKTISSSKWGWQIQPGTKWLPGHTNSERDELIQSAKITNINKDLYELLFFTKGLNLPQMHVNIEPTKRYLQQWKLSLEYIQKQWPKEKPEVPEKGIKELVGNDYEILPIFAHRYIVLGEDWLKVLSVWSNDDTIVYGDNLQEYLKHEFLSKSLVSSSFQ